MNPCKSSKYGFVKACKECAEDFQGRKEQFYCSLSCTGKARGRQLSTTDADIDVVNVKSDLEKKNTAFLKALENELKRA